MSILDSEKKIKKLDKSNMLGSIEVLYKQIKQAWTEVERTEIPEDYRDLDKVVINGMGGSGLGCHIIQSVYFKKLKVPVGNIHSYDLPGIVDARTLYIISSYSGSTEEPVGTFGQAKKRGAKILGITTGKDVAQLIKSGQMPGYIFDPKYNVCDEPRMGIGYSVTGILGLLKQCGVVKVKTQEIDGVIRLLKKIRSKFGVQVKTMENPAKQIAEGLKSKVANIVAADFLAGNAHVMANQINENAKNFSNYFVISELNHHLLEGLANPKQNGKNLHFILFESSLNHKKNQRRMGITKDIIRKNGIKYSSYALTGKTLLEQSFEMLLLGSYVSFYLAILNGVNPGPIPWVDYFKGELSANG